MRTMRVTARRLAHARGGGSLLLSLVVVTAVAMLTAAALQLSASFARHDLHAEHDTRAFYIAEAGVAEAYRSLVSGGTGQIGSRANPARAGDGVLWVDATEVGDRFVELDAVALSGFGRAAVSITVERNEAAIGFFSNRLLRIASPVMIDGFDSSEGPYIGQTTIDSASIFLLDLPTFDTLFAGAPLFDLLTLEGRTWRYVDRDGEFAYLQLVGDAGSGEVPDPAPIDEAKGKAKGKDKDKDKKKDEDEEVATSVPELVLEGEGGSLLKTLESSLETSSWGGGAFLDQPHTLGGARVLSNEGIAFDAAQAAVYGDVLPGPGASVAAGPGVLITGSTSPRPQALPLDTIDVPARSADPAVDLTGATPWVAPAGDSAFDGLSVAAGAEAVLRGPATLVLSSLTVEAGGSLVIENDAGPVTIYVTGAVDLADGSTLLVESALPSDLGLLVSGVGVGVVLRADSQFRGLVYAPQAEVTVDESFEIYGAALADLLVLIGEVRMHFDAAVADGVVSLPRFVSWSIAEVPEDLRVTRTEPFALLKLSADDLPSPAHAVESYSWRAVVKYKPDEGATRTFEGPLEKLDCAEVMNFIQIELFPPDVALTAPWTMRAVYDLPSTGVLEYEGGVDGLDLTRVKTLYELHLTPPNELLERGFAPTSSRK